MIVMKKDIVNVISKHENAFILHTDKDIVFKLDELDRLVEKVNWMEKYDFPYVLYSVNHNKLTTVVMKGDVGRPLYSICSKSGIMKLVNNLDEAKSLACKKSTKSCAYTVYKDGVAVVAYKNKKEMPDYKDIFYKEKDSGSVRIGVCGDKVRIKFRDQNEYSRGDGANVKTLYTWHTTTWTFHPDGKVYYYNGKTIRLCSFEKIGYQTLDEDEKKALLDALFKINPAFEKVYNLHESNPFSEFDDFWGGVKYSMEDIVRPFSFPTYCVKYDSYRKEFCKRGHRLLKAICRGLMEDNEIIASYAKKVKDFPVSKSFRKLYLKDLDVLERVRWIMELGFRNKDVIMKLISLKELPDEKFDTFLLRTIAKFINQVIRIKGETGAERMISEEIKSCSVDIARAIDGYGLSDDIVEFVIKECPNLASIHDTLVRYCSSGKYRLNNKEIPYSKGELKLNCEYSDVRFELAKDSKDLAIVGAKMGICVGGYANEAASKKCIIVKMIDNDKYVGCIDIRDKHVMQIKAKFNNPLEAKYKASLDKWVKENHLDSDCPDYDRIGMAWNSTHAYNAIDPEQYERHDGNRIEIVKRKTMKEEHANHNPRILWVGEDEEDDLLF